eukprot:CAMPEP_0203736010 /NCGR_PEP_ID=MMETSP0092-20131115/34497_1 /ASSEMBLY_ACC=CAM_ASM_001090 /TAXON_ID=426623 /ORGANISM="Chaetoceros affinis, Strain CCMP159" /LENGTH=31 /DNA_ID= /DNA_START= /DNA_END= /DNA_ORIENTATION=
MERVDTVNNDIKDHRMALGTSEQNEPCTAST